MSTACSRRSQSSRRSSRRGREALVATAILPRMPPAITRLTGVYHAEGSLLGELRYVIGSRLGRTHCALCDITHGRVREKAVWREARDRLAVPFAAVHLDEREPDVRDASE